MNSALDAFLERAVTYETEWPAQFDPRLRQAVGWSGVSLVATLLLLLSIKFLMGWSGTGFFLLLQVPFTRLMWFLAQHQQELLWMNLISLGIYVVLLWTTNFQTGKAIYHQIAFAEVIIGAASSLLLVLSLGIVVINLVAWVLLIILVCVVGLAFLMALSS
jgi:hypothetical protein